MRAGFDDVNAGEIFGQHLRASPTITCIELTHVDRERIFNLGYYTWVEQQGVSVADFDRRKEAAFWTRLQESIPAWDELITISTRNGAMRSARCARQPHDDRHSRRIRGDDRSGCTGRDSMSSYLDLRRKLAGAIAACMRK